MAQKKTPSSPKPKKSKKATGKRAGGRPSSFQESYVEQVYRLTLLGATDDELATFFGVNRATINRWKHDHPEFCDALKKGKVDADARVADRLHQRAMGFEYEKAVPIKLKEVIYSDGKRVKETERVEVVMVHEVVPPDTIAGIFWLKNRRPDQWRDKPPETPADAAEVARGVRDALRAIATADGLPQ